MSPSLSSADGIDVPTQSHDDIDQFHLLTQDAWRWRELDRPKARQLVDQVFQVSDDVALRSRAQIVQAYVYWREGRLAKALENILPAMSVMREENDLTWLARALNVRVCIDSELGEVTQSITGLEEQLRVSKQAGDLEMEACAIHDMGFIHLEREVSKAEPFLLRALELFREVEHNDGYAYSLLNLAILREGQGDVENARALLRQVMDLADQHGMESVKTHATAQQGRLELDEGNLAAARDLFITALARAEKTGDRPLAEVMPSLVTCYKGLGKLSEARVVLQRHLAALLKEGFLPFAAQAHELLTDILSEEGDFEAALKHSREHIRLYKKVYAQEHENKVRALEVLHRTQLAEQRVLIEEQRNKDLRHAFDELERLNEQTVETSLTDELTGLRNRRYLMTHVTKTLQDISFCLAVVDLDYFKRINDTYGHEGGDVVLKEFATLLKTQVREHDIALRLGGEEFIVIFPNTDLAGAKATLLRVLAAMKNHVWSSLGLSEPPTFTAGIAQCLDGDLKRALQTADALLYVGKANGRNGVWVEDLAVYPSVPNS
jgi:diguanylate cyclase (GGDEF)-like protein